MADTTSAGSKAVVVRPATSGLKTRKVLIRTVQYSILAALTVFIALPPFWLVISSFKTNNEILTASLALPKGLNLSGYVASITEAKLHLFFLNTVIVSGSTVVLLLAIATMAAYPLARYDFPFKRFLTLTFSLGILIPGITLVVPEVIIIRRLGLYQTKLGLIVMYTAIFFPISFLVLRSFFLSLPTELEEAAIIDGAGYFRTLLQVILPLSVPGLATVAVIIFIWSWNEFFYAFILTGSESSRTMQVAIRFFISQFDFNYSGLFAGVTVAMIPPVIAFVLFQEQVVSGLTAGAVKS